MPICEVIHWQNGMVMVFDEHGRQMSDYQGRYEDVAAKIKADTDERHVVFMTGNWQTGQTQEIPKASF